MKRLFLLFLFVSYLSITTFSQNVDNIITAVDNTHGYYQFNHDKPGTTAFWCCERVYDYFYNTFGRESYDNNSGHMIAFGHVGNDSLPNLMISLAPGINFIHSEINTYYINKSFEFDGIPPQNTLLEIDGQINTHYNIGFRTSLILKKKIINYFHNELLYNVGFTYKYLTTELTYSTHESHSQAADIEGSGKANWQEQYLSPVVGIGLYSQLGKKIYIENDINLYYNFLFKGRVDVTYTGEKYFPRQSGGTLLFSRNGTERYSRKKGIYSDPAIAHRLDIYYITGLNFLHKNNKELGIQIIIPFPYVVCGVALDRMRKYSYQEDKIPTVGEFAEPWYQKKYYKQITFSLTLNIYLQ